ncbi:MAG: DUF58 domain-containing protein [Proteobacteria bacterium]|nr:DUF58 domain-containing protein [Pseudomonadota bacterium]
MAQPDASLVPGLGPALPAGLAGEAARLSEILPHLVVEARNVAAQLQLGIHGRRRAGPGEEFWEFRPFGVGESVARIDWRRSAREERLFVREREWESASTHWLWVDFSPSMNFTSRVASRAKRDRAILIALALGDLLVHAGERTGLAGVTAPMASRNIVLRLAEAMLRLPEAARMPMPDITRLRRRDHLVLISDFIMRPDEFEARLAAIAERGLLASVVLIRDPVEEEFPFTGEIEFETPESPQTWRVGEARDLAARYRERIAAVNEELRRAALRHGFGFVKHLTHRPASETLLALAGMIGGQMPAAHSSLGATP